jgi:two-component system, NtrC family, C4-dicarboxylate transport response regulator DctD
MPGMDEISLLRHLRARTDDRAVIVVTGNGDIPMAIEAIAAGAFDVGSSSRQLYDHSGRGRPC